MFRHAPLRASLVCAFIVLDGAALGQTNPDEDDPGLRPSLEQASQSNPAGPRTNPGAPSRPTVVPPGSGAGTTGFVSTNTPARPLPPAGKRSGAADAPPTSRSPEITGTILRRPARRVPDEDPYGPAGVAVGSFVVKPTIELSAGYDDNATRTAHRTGSRVGRVEARVQTESNWSRHEFSSDLRGEFTKYMDVEHHDRPEAEATLRGRIDVTSQSRIEVVGKAALTTDAPGSPDAVTAAERPPHVYTFGGSTGFVQRFNRLELGLYGDVERRLHESARLISGGTLDRSGQDYTSYGVRARAGYELTPGVRPFIEAGVDRRVFDHNVDSNGLRTGSDGFTVRTGIAFEQRGFLTGEASIGYALRRYRDPARQDISGLTIDSSLIWKMSPLTTVTLRANSEIGETTLTDSSGVLTREAAVIIDHAFRRWLTGTLGVGYASSEYRGTSRHDQRIELSAGLTYHFSRYAALKGEFRHERLVSNSAGSGYEANIVFFGLRFRR